MVAMHDRQAAGRWRLGGALVTVVAASLVLAACAQPAAPSPAAGATAPAATAPAPAASPATAQPTAAPAVQLASEVIVAYPSLARPLDPHVHARSPKNNPMDDVWDGLTDRDASGNLVPSLAVSWTATSPTVWEFRLRPGVQFHDGTPFSSADVKFSIDRFRDPARQITSARFLQDITAIDTPDPLTVIIRTGQPDGLLPSKMVIPKVIPAAAYERLGEQAFIERPVGTGPYRVREQQPTRFYLLEAAPGNWRGAPPMALARYVQIPEPAGNIAALKTREIDVAYDLPPDLERDIRSDSALRSVVYNPNSSLHINLNQLRHREVADRRVRQAMNYAVDKQAVNQAVSGGYARLLDGQLVARGITGYNPQVQAYPYDVARARALMAEAGQASGFTTTMSTLAGIGSAVSQATAGYLVAIGIRAEIQQLDGAVFTQRFREGTLPALWYAGLSYADLNDADQVLTSFMGTEAEPIRRMNVPRFTELMAQSKVETDPARRERQLQEAAAILREEAPIIFLFQQGYLVAHNEKVTGLEPRPDAVLRMASLRKTR